MDLIFFDLDGTLLNKSSEISSFTKETLGLLGERDIAFTVATGRTMHSAQFVLQGQSFVLPHIYNKGGNLGSCRRRANTRKFARAQ